MTSVLLIEDSKEYTLLVNEALKHRHQIRCVETLAAARCELSKNKFEMIILDITLPDGDGFEFCSELRRNDDYSNIPVVLLTARIQPSDKVLGWNIGADDYVEKPFNQFEFQARIEAHVRKHLQKSELKQILVKGPLKLNLAFHEAWIVSTNGERRLSLTRNEFRLLHHLARHQDHVLTRDQLQQAVWGAGNHITDRTIDKHVSALRQKLEAESYCIQTVSGLGYRFTFERAA